MSDNNEEMINKIALNRTPLGVIIRELFLFLATKYSYDEDFKKLVKKLSQGE